jgi:ribosome recycling factor
MIEEILQDAGVRMDKSIDASDVPISQVANIGVEDARTLTVTPWEKPMVQAIEKAILKSDLGLNPATAGTVIRIPMPPLTEETRRDLVKVVRHDGEAAKVAIRNIRRDANSDFKELLKEKEISEDEERKAQDAIQKITDAHVAGVDKVLATKEAELMEI